MKGLIICGRRNDDSTARIFVQRRIVPHVVARRARRRAAHRSRHTVECGANKEQWRALEGRKVEQSAQVDIDILVVVLAKFAMHIFNVRMHTTLEIEHVA